jgi:serine protease Do
MPRLLAVLALLIAVLVSPYLIEQIQFAIVRGTQRAKADVARQQLETMPVSPSAFRLVAQAIEPCVVHINSRQVVGGRGIRVRDEWAFLDPPQVRTGQGSGVIVDTDGYILTNNHVIEGAAEVEVILSDGRNVAAATVVGTDALTDLAVLRVNLTGLTAAPWGDSNALEVGDWVVAVGNPFGLDRTVTAGIVSAKGRRGITGNSPYEDFLQTDAAVNPGNSGGPLVNMQGELVGINTAIAGDSFRGISFAIPSAIARDVYERLKENGVVNRGWLGVDQTELTPELAAHFGLANATGSLVKEVIPGSPAAKAGVKPGDVIVQWNDLPVANPHELSRAVARTEIGSTVEMVVMREGSRESLQVTVGQRPVEPMR